MNRVVLLAAVLLASGFAEARGTQQPKIVWTQQEAPIVQTLRSLRSLPDDVRARTTKQAALDIRKLPAGEHKVMLAEDLANLSTEGYFGHDTLQEVTTTLAGALAQSPAPDEKGEPASAYYELAQLVRYEHMQVSENFSQMTAVTAKLEATDKKRQEADFTLTDLNGKPWTLHDLRGKVVLVNFWATWCPPCRKEMPDIQKLSSRFAKDGLVVLAISDEEVAKVKPFIANAKYTYPILLDTGRKVSDALDVEGIPKTFIYDREGKLVAQSIDMRTERQFLEMLAMAGLK
jgi:peroxiredoxin